MIRLFQSIQKRFLRRTMYPEIEKAGGLNNALNIAFGKINSSLAVSTDSILDRIPVAYARVEEALTMIKDNLPPGIRPAVKGTAEDLLF